MDDREIKIKIAIEMIMPVLENMKEDERDLFLEEVLNKFGYHGGKTPGYITFMKKRNDEEII